MIKLSDRMFAAVIREGLTNKGFENHARLIQEIYVASSFCCESFPVVHKISKIGGFMDDPFLYSYQWAAVVRFKGEDFDFILLFPWIIDRGGQSMKISDKVSILMKECSADACKRILNEVIFVLWNYYCKHRKSAETERSARKIPDQIFSLKINVGGVTMEFIPLWYLEEAAYIRSLNYGGSQDDHWFASRNSFLARGFIFWEEWGEGFPPLKRFQGKIARGTFFIG